MSTITQVQMISSETLPIPHQQQVVQQVVQQHQQVLRSTSPLPSPLPSSPSLPKLGIGKNSHSNITEVIKLIKKEQEDVSSLVMPKFNSTAEERVYRIQRLIAGFRLFAKYGYDEGVAGHITVRDPDNPNHFWVNSFGKYFGNMKSEDLILVDETGNVIAGNGSLNKAAFVIHKAVHDARPDIVAAVHGHSMYGKVWSTTGRPLEPITQDSCSFYEDHAISEIFSGVVYDDSEGKGIAKSLGQKKAIILRNHGLLTVGETVDSALWNFMCLERTCQAQILAESIGKPTIIDKETALITRHQVGTPFVCWFQFQPYFEMIATQQPDILTVNLPIIIENKLLSN